jgi:DNA mismatch repair protein MutS2
MSKDDRILTMKQTLNQLLEFNQVIDIITPLTFTERGKRLIENATVLSVEKLQVELATVDQAMMMIARYSSLPLTHSRDLSLTITQANKEGVLSIEQLDYVGNDIRLSDRLLQYRKLVKDDYPFLDHHFQKLIVLDELLKQIEKAITPQLTIDDKATAQLYAIRQKIKKQEQKIEQTMTRLLNQYKDILTDQRITIRDGHQVLPVATASKRKVEGIIHGISDSGQTTFIEPSLIVSLNNEIHILKKEEAEEINRILIALTKQVQVHSNELLLNNETIGYLDSLSAKVNFANKYRCHVGVIANEIILNLSQARHPLIDQNKVIANDFLLDEAKSIIIISGPNAGGKTVAIKTVGLLVLLHQSGFPIPTNKPAKISYFNGIYADIGDRQSLADNLSTFAGHISNLAPLSNKIEYPSLVLIDELGTGTDPKEGEALATAILKYLQEQKALAIVSSHYSALKQLAYQEDKMINASMMFDEEKLIPTYHINYGMPGKSYGLTMANRYGLNPKIIDVAKNILLGVDDADINKMIDNLTQLLQQNEQLNRQLADQINQTKQTKQQAEQMIINYQKKLDRISEESEKIKQSMLKETEAKIDDAIKQLANPNIKLHEAIDIKRQLQQPQAEDDSQPMGEDISIGDYVSYDLLDIYGKVEKLTNKIATIITSDGKSIKVNPNLLTKTASPQQNQHRPSATQINKIDKTKSVGLELNVIGLRVEEALSRVKGYLDDVLLANYKTVRIIHGLGTGALRRAIHEFLKGESYVDSYHLGSMEQGGLGATIVKIK